MLELLPSYVSGKWTRLEVTISCIFSSNNLLF